MKKGKIHIGTSGWSYDHWKENFYPPEVKSAGWLEFYAKEFPTVEINNTFHRMPKESVVENWHNKVPEDFRFSVKASQYITHRKRLHECEESMEYFFKVMKNFKEKLGIVLFQLPPSFKMNQERLVDFLKLLSNEYRYVFEFRHETWYNDEIYDLLSKHKIALCVTDLGGSMSPDVVTTDFTYLRLHGPEEKYTGTYGPKNLQALKKRFDKHLLEGTSVYCYFDNDDKGFAIQDAKTLKALYS